MKYFNALFVFLLIIIATTAYAQKDTGSEKITVFDNGANTVFKNAKQTKSQLILMKFNIYTEFIGDVPVYIEKQITNNISIEAAPGVTFINLMYDIIQPSSNTNNNILLALPYNSDAKDGIGYSFKVDARYYPGEDDMMEGIYVSPEIGYRHYVVDYPNSGATGGYDDGYTNVTDFKFIFGYQSDQWVEGVYVDYYLGIGVRLISGLQFGDITTQQTYYGSVSSWAQEPFSYWRPGFYAGIKLGFGL